MVKIVLVCIAAVRRLNMYAEAGADILQADALVSREHIATVAKNVAKPVSVSMGSRYAHARLRHLSHPKIWKCWVSRK